MSRVASKTSQTTKKHGIYTFCDAFTQVSMRSSYKSRVASPKRGNAKLYADFSYVILGHASISLPCGGDHSHKHEHCVSAARNLFLVAFWHVAVCFRAPSLHPIAYLTTPRSPLPDFGLEAQVLRHITESAPPSPRPALCLYTTIPF